MAPSAARLCSAARSKEQVSFYTCDARSTLSIPIAYVSPGVGYEIVIFCERLTQDRF
jgi:hypothetical protein